jgi:hypothetical protein
MRLMLASVLCVWIWSGVPLVAATQSKPVETVTLQGKVLTLTEALEANRLGVTADAEQGGKEAVLLSDDGAMTPLLEDETSRALFMDKRLRNRKAQIVGRHYPGVPFLQVVTIQVEHEGRLRTPEYFCDVCTISVRYPQICPCCQGPMEYRMKPESQ